MKSQESVLSEDDLKDLPDHIESIRILKNGDKPLSQEQEWCYVTVGGKQRKIRFHDYAEIYKIPGLYEHIFYNHLKCCSPYQVTRLLKDVLKKNSVTPDSLSVLDLGAGNGMVGEELKTIGVKKVVGADILPEAHQATLRDRPEVYQDYHVADFLDLSESTKKKLKKYRFNCLTTVATLGFHDIPTKVFMKALSLVSSPGWVAFNIKEDFLKNADNTGFRSTIRKLEEKGVIKIEKDHHYQHRLSAQGHPLFYNALVAKVL